MVMTRAQQRQVAAWEPSPNIVHEDPVAANNPLAGRNPESLTPSERRQLTGQGPTRAEKRRRVQAIQAEIEEESGYTLEEQEELARRQKDEAEYIAKRVASQIASSVNKHCLEETMDVNDMYAHQMEQTMSSIDDIINQFQDQQSMIPEHILQQQQPQFNQEPVAQPEYRFVGYVPPRNVNSQYVFEQGALPTDENWTDEERFFPADAFPRNFYSDKEPIWFNTVPVYEVM